MFNKDFILISNKEISAPILEQHYKYYKPVLDQITNRNVNVSENAHRVLNKAVRFNDPAFENPPVSSVLDVCKVGADSYEKVVESACFNSAPLNSKFVYVANNMERSNDVFFKNISDVVAFGKQNCSIPLKQSQEYANLVEKIADFHGLQDYACLVKIKAFCTINECLTCLVVEHRICMIIGCTLFIQHVYYKVHTQNGAFEMFISDIVDRTFVKFTKMHTRVLRIAYDYRAPLLRVAAIGISGTAVGAGLKYWTQSPAESRYTFTGPLGQLFKEVSSILVKITYSTISTLTDVQMAIFRATFGKRAELFFEWLKDLNEKIKKN